MKVVVIGGTGLVGAKFIKKLREKRLEVVAASPSTGINALTGEGLAEALKGANIVVDVANSPSFADEAVLYFFETSTRNLLQAEKEAGVGHHVALSVVGTELLTESGYFRAKLVQENLIASSSLPYTIVRATQFFEFLNSIFQACTVGDTIRVPAAFIQPMAADDVAEALSQIALEKPKNGILEIAGPERLTFQETAKKYFTATRDFRKIIASEETSYFGVKLNATTLVPQREARLSSIYLGEWLKNQPQEIANKE